MTVLKKSAYVGIGGCLGANARYWLVAWVTDHLGDALPYGTFIANISGSFFLGLFVTFVTERYFVFDPALHLLIAVGFIGSYTTFSTFKYETFALAVSGSSFRALLNVGLSVIAGLVAVWLGVRLARFTVEL